MTFESGRLLIDVLPLSPDALHSDARSIIISNKCFLGQKNKQKQQSNDYLHFFLFYSIRDINKQKSRLSSYEIKQKTLIISYFWSRTLNRTRPLDISCRYLDLSVV